MKRSGLIWACPVMVFVLAAACGGSTPPPAEPKPEPAVTTPPPPPEPEPVAEEKKPAEPEEAPPPKEDTGPKRPLATYNSPTGPVTVGLDGAVVRLANGAELRIPGGSLNVARNVGFSVDSRFRGDTGKIGDAYLIEVQVPDRKYEMGEAHVSRPHPTSGDNFIIKLPLPAGKDAANLAVETVEMDAKNKGKSTWTIVAQTKLESADTGNKAVFEIKLLPDAHVHLTTKAAGE